MIINPYRKFIEDFGKTIYGKITSLNPSITLDEIISQISEPPLPSYGDLGFISHRFAKKISLKPQELAEFLAKEVMKCPGVQEYRIIDGYLNIVFKPEYVAEIVIKSIKDNKNYGNEPVDKPLRIIVEHTSANPIHPLHIGHARNAFLGDTLANLLKARGHIVQTRFYINDTGRQVAILALGYRLLGEKEPPPNVKPDEWLGRIYALTNLLMELKELKKKIKDLEKIIKGKNEFDEELVNEYREFVRRQDELASDLSKLWELDRELFNELSEAILGFEGDLEEEVSRIMKAYEKGEEWAKKLVRKVVSLALKGIRETLNSLEIHFDKWDYESDLVWQSLVNKVIELAKKTKYYTIYKGAEAIDLTSLSKDKELKKKLNITLGSELPPLILRRSDGTVLYTTKDIAYTIYKFRDFNADKVINVIGAEQRLPQMQLKLALYAIGFVKEAENLIPYLYEMVAIPGMKMSSRRYRIITLDRLLNELYVRARREVDMRRSDLSDEEKDKIAWSIAKAAIKFQMAGSDPLKPLTFNFDKALNLKENSAPYLMYTYARANSILRKAGEIDWDNISYDKVGEGTRKKLLWLMGKYPWIVSKAADDLAPELLASYLITLADEFNKWYGEEKIIHEHDTGLRNLKLAITYGVRHIIGHGLRLFGIKPLPRI